MRPAPYSQQMAGKLYNIACSMHQQVSTGFREGGSGKGGVRKGGLYSSVLHDQKLHITLDFSQDAGKGGRWSFH